MHNNHYVITMQGTSGQVEADARGPPSQLQEALEESTKVDAENNLPTWVHSGNIQGHSGNIQGALKEHSPPPIRDGARPFPWARSLWTPAPRRCRPLHRHPPPHAHTHTHTHTHAVAPYIESTVTLLHMPSPHILSPPSHCYTCRRPIYWVHRHTATHQSLHTFDHKKHHPFGRSGECSASNGDGALA
jgi:hypothetical protein